MEELLSSLGIQHQLTVRYQSHQNPIAERINLTVFNGIRASLIASQLPLNQWNTAMSAVTHTRNHSPAKALDMSSTPEAVLKGNKPNFSHLRRYGETCVKVTEVIDRRKAGSTKLWRRGGIGRFVGYTVNKKAYDILLLDGSVIDSTNENTRFLAENAVVTPLEISPPVADIDFAPEDPNDSSSDEDNSDPNDSDSNSGDSEDSEDSFYTSPSIKEEEDAPPTTVPASPAELEEMRLTAIPNQPNRYHHPTHGIVELQDRSIPAPKSTLNPPSHAKRVSKPPSANSATAEPCSRCISCCIAQEASILPAAATFMSLASLAWLKEMPSVNRASAVDPTIPKNHHNIKGRDDEEAWIKAEDEEIAQLLAMGTWEVVPLPKGKKAIKSKWVYRKKTDNDGNVIRYKARLCACGYSQKAGVDYKDIYSPVFRMESSRLFLVIVASRKMKFIQMDVTGAFLNGNSIQDQSLSLIFSRARNQPKLKDFFVSLDSPMLIGVEN